MKGGDARIIKDNRFHTVHGEYVEQQVFVIEYIEVHILYGFCGYICGQIHLQRDTLETIIGILGYASRQQQQCEQIIYDLRDEPEFIGTCHNGDSFLF